MKASGSIAWSERDVSLRLADGPGSCDCGGLGSFLEALRIPSSLRAVRARQREKQ